MSSPEGEGPQKWLTDGLGSSSDKFPLVASLAYEMAFDIVSIKQANTFPKLTKRSRAPDIYGVYHDDSLLPRLWNIRQLAWIGTRD